MSVQTAPQAYRESSVLTASPERLVVLLYDGARRFLTQAAAAMRDGDIPRSHDRLRHGEAILEELRDTLDLSAGDIAQRLLGIYVFALGHLNEARIERDPDKITQVVRLLSDLRESWAELAASRPQEG